MVKNGLLVRFVLFIVGLCCLLGVGFGVVWCLFCFFFGWLNS